MTAATKAPELVWHGLSQDEVLKIVGEICDHGTGFVAPLITIIELIDKVLRERNATAPQRIQAPEGALRAAAQKALDFLDAAAGEGFVLVSLDAADLHEELRAALADQRPTTPAGVPSLADLRQRFAGIPDHSGKGAAVPSPAEAHGDARWPLAKYSQRQQKWCAHYQRMTGFEPLMCDFEAGNQSFVEAAKLSVDWYESHTGDMFLAITRRPIPGSEYDMGDDHE